jgi:regulator of replication initiation timing
MNETPTKIFEAKIAEIVQRVRTLAEERDAVRFENDGLKSMLATHERENARLRAVLDEAVRELRQEEPA